jgi:hypothetical protein
LADYRQAVRLDPARAATLRTDIAQLEAMLK